VAISYIGRASTGRPSSDRLRQRYRFGDTGSQARQSAVGRVASLVKQSGDSGTAARIQASYAAAHPDDPAAQIGSGEAALQAGDVDTALANFKRAAQLAPGHADAHYGLARTYLAKNQPSEAVAEFQSVLTAEPRHVRALNGMGIALDLLGRDRDAQNAYRAGLAAAPDNVAIRNNLGLSLLLSRDYDPAVAELSTSPATGCEHASTTKLGFSAGTKARDRSGTGC
jgi:Flp pilus assembly protein TadD